MQMVPKSVPERSVPMKYRIENLIIRTQRMGLRSKRVKECSNAVECKGPKNDNKTQITVLRK